MAEPDPAPLQDLTALPVLVGPRMMSDLAAPSVPPNARAAPAAKMAMQDPVPPRAPVIARPGPARRTRRNAPDAASLHLAVQPARAGKGLQTGPPANPRLGPGSQNLASPSVVSHEKLDHPK